MSNTNSRFKTLVDAAKKNIKEIDAEQLSDLINSAEDFLLIDVREDSDCMHGVLPGAVHISRGVLELKIEKVAPKLDRHIVLYCGGGSRSALSAESLQKMGYSNVYSLIRGFRGWYEAGLPIEGGQ